MGDAALTFHEALREAEADAAELGLATASPVESVGTKRDKEQPSVLSRVFGLGKTCDLGPVPCRLHLGALTSVGVGRQLFELVRTQWAERKRELESKRDA